MTTTTTFDLEYPVKKLKAHPKNPRRNAVADPDMVASIKEHGVLEPAVIAADGTIIMGHRRWDGSKKARKTTIAVVIRPDLDTPEKQLEVALVENIHREGLSEMEEAESFDLLRELGYNQKQIATKVGRSPKVISDRLKLLRLSKKSQDALHKGQLTFGHAIALAEFDDDPKLQDALAKKSGHALEQSLDRARRDRKAMAEISKRVAEYEKAGVPEVKVAAGTRRWDLRKPDCTLLEDTHPGRRPQSHKKCMGYVILPGDPWSPPTLELVCTNPKGHKKPGPSKAELAEKARREQEQAERAAATQARDEASAGRVHALLELAPAKVDDRLADVLRVMLPTAIYAIPTVKAQVLFDWLDVAEDCRWTSTGYYRSIEDVAALGRFMKMLGSCSQAILLRALIGLLALTNEAELGDLEHEHLYQRTDENGLKARLIGRRYLGLLEGIGHDLTDVDQALLEAAKWSPPKPEISDSDDPYEWVHLHDGDGLTKCRLPAAKDKALNTVEDVDDVTCPECTTVEAVAW